MNNICSTLATVWRIAAPYFRSEDKWAGRGLLAAVISIELALVAIDVLLNQWSNRFYTGLQEYNWDVFVREIGVFCVLATCFIGLAVYQLYLNQWLQIRWRRWLTKHYLGEWLHGANHYRMQLQGDAADNPDQRIADDVKLFVERTLDIGLNLLNSVVTLFSFVIILWGLSEAAPLHVFGKEYPIPGYLVWGALIYAVFGTALTQWIGSPLVQLDFRQQRFEADFRFNLVRARENSEQIALLQGESAERQRLWERFNHVVENWYGIMSRTKRLTAFTSSYSQAAVIFPYILVTPAYFAEKDPARRPDADGIRLRQRAEGAVDLRHDLPHAGGLARHRRPSRRIRDVDRKRHDAGNSSALDRCRIIRRQQGDRPAASSSCGCPTARRWSRPTGSACTPESARCSPARQAPANRPCSAPSPASGRSEAARSTFRPTHR